MLSPKLFADQVSEQLCSGVFGVPDSLLANLTAEFEKGLKLPQVTACNEGSAVGIAIGSYFATGKPALVYMQNSGLGNAINPLVSLADEAVYGVPVVLLIGWRGQPGIQDEPQHVKQGQITEALLEVLGLPILRLPKSDTESISVVRQAFELSLSRQGPVAILVEKGSFSKLPDEEDKRLQMQGVLSREDAMKIVHRFTQRQDKVVSTTGMLSRELEEFQASLVPEEQAGTLLVVGGMGHASSIALGIAVSKPQIRVWCFDGDGAVLMHLGALPVIANIGPKNFIHVVFDNGAHDSVGGQLTLLGKSDLTGIAREAGYARAYTANSEEQISEKLEQILAFPGPGLLVIKVKTGSRSDLGRPQKTPSQLKSILMKSF